MCIGYIIFVFEIRLKRLVSYRMDRGFFFKKLFKGKVRNYFGIVIELI